MFLEELKMKRLLSKFGYDKEQIKKIISVIKDEAYLLCFIYDYKLSDYLIDEYIKFLSGDFSNYKSYMLNIDFNKRNSFIIFCNQINKEQIKTSGINLFRLLYNISTDYTDKEFNKILFDLLKSNLDYDYINNLNEEYKKNAKTKVLVKKNKNN